MRTEVLFKTDFYRVTVRLQHPSHKKNQYEDNVYKDFVEIKLLEIHEKGQTKCIRVRRIHNRCEYNETGVLQQIFSSDEVNEPKLKSRQEQDFIAAVDELVKKAKKLTKQYQARLSRFQVMAKQARAKIDESSGEKRFSEVA